MNIQKYIRIVDTYRRTFSCFITEIIHNRIFHLIRNEFRMAELIAEYYCIDSERLVHIEIFFPWNSLYLIINLIGIFGCKVFNWLQDTDGGAKAKIRLIHHTFISCE